MNKYHKYLLFLLSSLLTAKSGLAQDWAELKTYQAANQKLKDSLINAVYIGDSITAGFAWQSADFFRRNHYIGRGIGGQTSPQILLRFRQDVIALKPKVVVILCGTNDIAGNTGPMTPEMTVDNIKSMAELAQAHGIKVVLCSVLPADHFGWNPGVKPADNIISLNKWIRAYAKSRRFNYVDYYSAMVNDQKGFRKEFSEDGVHPNKAGYAIMEPLVMAAINKML